METRRERILSLEILHVLGFCMIFLNHTANLLPFKIPDLGARGVEIFFVLSGFTMAYNYYGKNLPINLRASMKFCYNKIKKFYLLYIITFIAAAYWVLYDLERKSFTFLEIIKFIIKAILNLSLLQSWFPKSEVYFSFNGVSWYLSTLVFCYFMTPLILYIIEKMQSTHNWIKLGVFILLFKILFETVWVQYVRWNSGFVFHVFPVYRILEYIVGCLFGAIFLSEKTTNVNQNNISTSIMQVFALILYIVAVIAGKSTWLRAYYVLFVVLLVYTLSIEKGIFYKLVKNKIILHLSTISLEFFMIHQVVIHYVYRLWPKILSSDNSIKEISLCLIFVVCLLLSEFIHYGLLSLNTKAKTKAPSI